MYEHTQLARPPCDKDKEPGWCPQCSPLQCGATETRQFTTARLVRGLVGAYNERPHGDSKVPPYSASARFMRSALAELHCDQCEVRGTAVLCCASTVLIADGVGLSATGTERYVAARGHARQLGTTLGRTTRTQWGITPHRSLQAGRDGRHDSIRQFPFADLPRGVTNSLGVSTLRAPSGLGAKRSRAGGDGGRSAGPGRSAHPGAGLPASSVSHHATGSPRKQAVGLTATGSLGALGGAAR